MSKMIHDQPSAAVPASRDRRNFLIAGAGLALAATTLGRSGAVMAKPAGQDTPNAPSDAAPVRKETLTTRKLGSLEVSSMGLGCLPMVGYYGGGPRDQPDALAKNMVLLEFAQSWARRKNTTPVQFALAWVMAQRPSTSLAIRPGHRELFIVANSGTEPGGAMIFRSGAFAPAPFPFSHQ